MIQLPNNEKCYSLPEQVAQNLLNIKYLAEQYANIDALPDIWAAYKSEFDSEIETFGNWTTTFEGWDTTLSTYLANMSSAAVGAISGQNIAPANITSSGTFTASHAKIYETLEDSSDHKRFVEGNGTTVALTGVTIVYNKWSLSGSHIMFVCAGNVAENTVIPNAQVLGDYAIPQWILDKIYPVFGTNVIERKAITFSADDYSTQDMPCSLEKIGNHIYIRQSTGATTFTKDRGFRIQFDLLIDNE